MKSASTNKRIGKHYMVKVLDNEGTADEQSTIEKYIMPRLEGSR